MGRELDARVARALNLDVVGEAWCWNPDGGGWSVNLWAGESKDGGTYGVLRPVYLGRCMCDYYETDPLAQEMAEYETKQYGHYHGCLDMVAFYSTEWAAMQQVVEWMNREKKWIVRITALWDSGAEVEVYSDEGHPSHWFDVADADALTAPEAICLAFLAAMGK